MCIEAGLGVVVQILNALATAQAASGASPVPFYFAFGLNCLMIVLEMVEIRRTRKHGGVQTPWDRFWFGQWIASTPKNFYAKYTSRVQLGVEFYINLTALPVMIVASASVQASVSVNPTGEARIRKVRPGAVESGRLASRPLCSMAHPARFPPSRLRDSLLLASTSSNSSWACSRSSRPLG